MSPGSAVLKQAQQNNAAEALSAGTRGSEASKASASAAQERKMQRSEMAHVGIVDAGRDAAVIVAPAADALHARVVHGGLCASQGNDINIGAQRGMLRQARRRQRERKSGRMHVALNGSEHARRIERGQKQRGGLEWQDRD